MSERKKEKREYRKYLSHNSVTVPKSTKYRRLADEENPGSNLEKAGTSQEPDSSMEEIPQDLTSSSNETIHDTSSSDGHDRSTKVKRYYSYLTFKGGEIPRTTQYRRSKSKKDPRTSPEGDETQNISEFSYEETETSTHGSMISGIHDEAELFRPESDSHNSTDEECEQMTYVESTNDKSDQFRADSRDNSRNASGDEFEHMASERDTNDESEQFTQESLDSSRYTSDEEFEHMTSEREDLTDDEDNQEDDRKSNTDSLNDADEQFGDKDNDMEYNAEGWNDPLYAGASVTLGQTVLIIMALMLTAGLTKDALGTVLWMLKVLLPSDSILPSTYYLFNKLFRCEKFNIHLYCPDCFVLLQNEVCVSCNNMWSKDKLYKDQSYFIASPLVPQFRHVLENQKRGADLNYRNTRSTAYNSINDMYDGKLYREMCQKTKLADDFSFSLTMNSDGVPIFKSSSYSIWPILSFINEFPPEIRKRHIFLSGLWFGKCKPVISTFFNFFTEELRTLANIGFEWNYNGRQIVSYVYCIVCSCDSVARPLFQNIKQFNGKFGCNWCLHPGTRVEKNKGYVLAYDARDDYPARNHTDTVNHMRTANHERNDVFGVKGPSQFLLIPHFDIVHGFVVDYMHCVDLGITRTLASLWLDSQNHDSPWYIGTKSKEIDKKIYKFHPPKNITRLPRSLAQRAYWKASEWRSFLIFYGPLVLRSILPGKYFRHYLLLCQSIFILQQESITQLELFRAQSYLTKFVSDYQTLYGIQNMNYNIHMLVHIVDSVRNWGPLWCFSAYSFESFNGVLLKLFHGTQAVPLQMFKSYLLLKKVEYKSMATFINAPESIRNGFLRILEGYPHIKKAEKLNEIVLFGTGLERYLTIYEKHIIQEHFTFVVSSRARFYQKAVVSGTTLHGINYVRSQVRNNTFVQVNDNKIYQLNSFVKVTSEDDTEHVLCLACPVIISNVQIAPKCNSTGSLISHIHFIDHIESGILCTVNMDQIERKLIYYHDNDQALCQMPNTLERD